MGGWFVSKCHGFTLTELILTIAIIGIIGITAISLSRSGIELQQAARSFSLSIQKARSEAIKRNEFAGVTITASKFSVFIDEDKNKSFDIGEEIVLQVDMLANYPSVSLASNSNNDIVFDPRGFVASIVAQSVTFKSSKSNSALKTIISAQGRVRLEKVDS